MYGSAMTKTKRNILLELGIEELVIAIDFDYTEESYSNKKEYEPLTDWEIYENKVYKIADMFKGWCNVSAIVDYVSFYDYLTAKNSTNQEIIIQNVIDYEFQLMESTLSFHLLFRNPLQSYILFV